MALIIGISIYGLYVTRNIKNVYNRKILNLDWGEKLSKKDFKQKCKKYLINNGWIVRRPWNGYSDIHILKKDMILNLTLVTKKHTLHNYFINDARQAMQETQQIIMIITSYEPSFAEMHYAKLKNVPLLFYKDMRMLLDIALEFKFIEAARNSLSRDSS